MDTIDLLVGSLERLGAPVAAALAPVGPATDALRVLIAASRPSTPAARTAGKDGDAPAPACSRPAVLSSKRPGDEWLSRDPLRAEREYLNAHRASLELSETDSHFRSCVRSVVM
ncbi:hypothetical protein [Streptomyces griseofuscus]|uniref:hypothetical protein n=1 Tax=Streptomyces griseofuscus TaxID=146922 RepID=UPI003452413D